MNPAIILLSIAVIVIIIVAIILMRKRILTFNPIRFPRTCQADSDCEIYKIDLMSSLANNFCGECKPEDRQNFINNQCYTGGPECVERIGKIFDKKCVGVPPKICKQGFLGTEHIAYETSIDGYSGEYECDYKDARCG
jgi:hypothetical protein